MIPAFVSVIQLHPNLMLLNKLRRIACDIVHDGFQQDYQATVSPLLNKYRSIQMEESDMQTETYEAIRAIYQLSITYQFDYAPGNTRRNIDNRSKLWELEKAARGVMLEHQIEF
ncbi:hypothetical protein ACFVS2_20680 [Brevibacillus sp. NPDC058079]|uniref:hypothetical protein n=1 Tax=Brevibacillus sp. NPDC058079 TaxID=3346330 RepID=UPI0036EDBC51